MHEENRYQFITQQIQYHFDKIFESFSLFIKLGTAIIGGFAWLISQDLDPAVKRDLVQIAPWLLTFVGASCCLLIVVYVRGKWIFRKLEQDLLGDDNYPTFPKSCLGEIIMVVSILILVVGFWFCAGTL